MFTASIVVHKTPPEKLDKALKSLLFREVKKVYIIDNGPDTGLKHTAETDSRIIYSKVKNKGYGAAHNIALKEVIKNGEKFHLIMNPDVYWDGDIMKPMIECLINNPKIGIISPKIIYPDGKLQYSCRRLPSPADLFLKRFVPDKFKRKRMKKYLLEDFDHQTPLNCPYLLGCFMLFNLEAVKETGYFDERFFLYPEDIDITRRIHRSWETLYWPFVSVEHEHQAESYKNLKMLIIHSINMVRYFNKWGWIKDDERKNFNDKLSGQLRKKSFSPYNLK